MDAEVEQIKLSAVRAIYGDIGPNLIRYTASLQGTTLHVQIVVHGSITSSELDDYLAMDAQIIGDFEDMVADEKVHRIFSADALEAIEPLPIKIFARALGSFEW